MSDANLQIFVVRDQSGSHAHRLDQPMYTIGRSDKADIRIRSTADISRHHATLVRATTPEGTFYYQLVDGDAITGKASTNGTYVNNERIAEHPLVNSDQVLFGSTAVGKFFYLGDRVTGNPDFIVECKMDRQLKAWAIQEGISIDRQLEFSAPLKIPTKPIPKPKHNPKPRFDARATAEHKAKFAHPSRYGQLGQFFLRKAQISSEQLDQALQEVQKSNYKKLGQVLIDQGLISDQDLEQALHNQRIQLGEILIKRGLITPEQLDHALEQQRLTRKMLGEILVVKGLISNQDLKEALEEQYWRQSGFWFLQ
jgi:hypothetical protein